MPVKISGDGTITGLTVGGLPNGVVDEDTLANLSVSTGKLANNAVTAAKSTGLGTRKYTYGSWVNTNSGTTVEFTGIAATNEFYIDWSVVGVNANQELCAQIGDSGGYEDDGYHNSCGYLGSGSTSSDASSSKWITYGTASAVQHRSGRMRLQNLDGNIWYMEFFYVVDSEGNVYAWKGTKTLSGQLDRIKFYAASGASFDQGKMRYVKVEDLA